MSHPDSRYQLIKTLLLLTVYDNATLLLKASSLIKINEATFAELQQLKLIGPARAEKIVQYRTQVEPIFTEQILAAVSGLNIKQIAELDIDWQSNQERPLSLTPALIAYFISFGLFVLAVSVIGFSFDSWVQTAYNLGIVVLLAGCECTITAIFATSLWISPRWKTKINRMGLVLICIAFVVLMLLVAITDSADAELKQHLRLTFDFLFYGMIILAFLYLPSLHVQLVPRVPMLSNFNFIAHCFDYGQILIGLVICMELSDKTADSSLLQVIFSIWLGIVCLIHSTGMYQGRSSYTSSLSDKDLDRVAYFIRQSGQQEIKIRFQNSTSILLGAIGIGLLAGSYMRFSGI